MSWSWVQYACCGYSLFASLIQWKPWAVCYKFEVDVGTHNLITPTMFKFATLLCAVACATSSFATVATVEADLGTLLTQINALDTSIVAFPATGGTLAQALVSPTLVYILLLF